MLVARLSCKGLAGVWVTRAGEGGTFSVTRAGEAERVVFCLGVFGLLSGAAAGGGCLVCANVVGVWEMLKLMLGPLLAGL